MQQLLNDPTIGIIDREKFLCSYPSSKIDFGIQPGDPIPEGDHNINTALKGEISSTILPAELYGTEIKASAIPIKDDDGKILGAIVVGVLLDQQMKLDEYMKGLKSVTTMLQEKIQIVASHSKDLAIASGEIKAHSSLTLEDSQSTKKIVDFIKRISQQTNLLGLNATIEASRSGVHGAGFNVVAKEVRNLSNETSNATDQIDSTLQNISVNIKSLSEQVTQITVASNEQAILVNEFGEIITQLNLISEEMREFVESLLI